MRSSQTTISWSRLATTTSPSMSKRRARRDSSPTRSPKRAGGQPRYDIHLVACRQAEDQITTRLHTALGDGRDPYFGSSLRKVRATEPNFSFQGLGQAKLFPWEVEQQVDQINPFPEIEVPGERVYRSQVPEDAQLVERPLLRPRVREEEEGSEVSEDPGEGQLL
eukprot:CAMPEP_0170511206 /NCGR_PEP_ID=MMETSP0208-20121228/66179_1 /TAXON_ID=197538 /ORGANISM="Strombidium inclinatum, Strain S3" /LENGTH=164 /DNA_ID=CAMNT_0010794725 /DNA_START=1511 /DNA_END=2003 /DNA_ORIENTATION=-